MNNRFTALSAQFGLLLVALITLACSARQPGSPLNPGFNLYSKQQDIELGRQAAQEVRQELDVVNNQELQRYLDGIGQRLAATDSAEDYPYTFSLLNDESINAFALPGGPTFVNSGLLEAADTEAQLAGVMSHELAHIVLRHGTSQASKANLLQLPAQLAGVFLSDGQAAQLGQLGIGLGLNLLMLRYSRSAESEADALGAHIMAEAGYNPVSMARFFEKLQEGGAPRAPEFLSDHPDPGNRVQAVQAEIQTLPNRTYREEIVGGNLDRMQEIASRLPPPNRTQEQVLAANMNDAPRVSNAGDLTRFQNGPISILAPQDWQPLTARGSNVWVLAPRRGLAKNPYGGVAIGYGVLANYFPSRSRDLNVATRELLSTLTQNDPTLQVQGNSRSITVNGNAATVTPLSGRSPFGGRESNQLLTLIRPEGLFYMIFVAPESQSAATNAIFNRMLDSLQFAG